MRLELEGSLPFVAVRIGYRGAEVVIRKVLIDTGSAGTLLSVDAEGVRGFEIPSWNFKYGRRWPRRYRLAPGVRGWGSGIEEDSL